MIQQLQIEKELICQEHNESAIFIDFSKKDLRLQNRCQKCVQREMQLWVDVQDADKHLENVKRTVLNDKQIFHQKNLEIISELSSQLKQLKTTFNNNLDKTLINIEQQIQFISNVIEKENTSIINLSISRLYQFESQNSGQQFQQIDYRQIQQFYREQIKRLKMDENFLHLEENLKKIQFSQQDIVEEVIRTFSSEILQSSKTLNQLWQCEDHKISVVLVDLNEQATVPNRLACVDCVAEYPIKYTKLDQLKQSWFNYVEKAIQFQEQQSIILNEKAQNVIQQLPGFYDIIADLIQQLSQTLLQRNDSKCQTTQRLINLKMKNWFQLNKSEIIEISNIISKKQKQEIINDAIRSEFQVQQTELNANFSNSFKTFQENFLSKFKQIIEEIEKEFNTVDKDYLPKIEENSLLIESQIFQETNQKIIQKPFKYEKINSIKDERIEAFAFNENYSLLAAGYYNTNNIKIYEFNKGQMIVIQELTDHKNSILCLKFFKKSTQLVSGSHDSTIILWEINKNNIWDLKIKLNGHDKGIFCLTINNNENQIISGSHDQSIKIWDKDSEWRCIQTLSQHNNEIASISLSQSNQYFVSCAMKDDQISIFKFQVNSRHWNLFQKLKIDACGLKVCFLDNSTFAFQPFNNAKMYIFELNDSNNQFIKKCDVEVKTGIKCYFHFPLQFISSKLMIVNRNGNKVNFIKKQENGSYLTQFVIDYQWDSTFNQNKQVERIFGTMTEDGEYLITWDNQSQEIQVRQYRE